MAKRKTTKTQAKRRSRARKPSRPLRLEYVEAGSLADNPRNWRRHPEAQTGALRAVIEDPEIGWAGALLYNERTGRLIDGHDRKKIVGPKGLVPVLIGSWSKRAEMKILATLDPLAAMATPDAEQLQSLLDDVDLSDDAFAGLLDELQDQAGQLLPQNSSGVVEDEVPEPPKKAITIRGDLWLLGDHRVFCGDARNLSHVERALSAIPRCAVYDPPWDDPPLIELPANRIVFADGATVGQSVSRFGAPTWLFVWDCITSWYTPNRPLRRMKIALWYGPLRAFKFDGAHYGHPGESRVVENTRRRYRYQADPRGKHLSDLFAAPITREHSDDLHHHGKPLDWVRLLLGDCTEGLIYDPFLGSGTTLIAAEQLDRKCYGLEIEPRYCDVIVERWQNLTGKKAKRKR